MRLFGWILLASGGIGLSWTQAQVVSSPPDQTHALADSFRGRSWEIDEGYPDVTATCFAQTSDGYLWIGTFGQLLRFDGLTFVEIEHPDAPALGHSMVLDLKVDADGALWVATSKGIGRYRDGRWAWFGPAQGVPAGISRDVEIDGSGNVYVTLGNQLLQLRDERFENIALPLPSEKPDGPLRIIIDGGGVIHAIDHAWLAGLGPEGWTIIAEGDPAAPEPLFEGLAPAAQDGMWVGDKGTIRKWSAGAWRETLPRPAGQRAGVVTILEDRRDGLWGGSYVSGLFRIGADGVVENRARDVGLRNPSILSIFEDAEGDIWVGTNGGGILRLRPRTIRLSTEDHEMAQSIINSLMPHDGGFLLATHGAGVRQWRDGKFSAPFWVHGPIKSSWPHAVWVDPDGRCWIGSYANGLYTAKPGHDSELVAIPPEAVPGKKIVGLLRDNAGSLWVASDLGVSIQSPTGTWQQWSPPDVAPAAAGITSMANDHEGAVWLTSRRGQLWRWNEGAEMPTRITAPGAEHSARVQAVISARTGGVWTTLLTGQIGRWRGDQWTVLASSDDLPAGDWTVILDDGKSHLWLAGREGLLRLSIPADGQSSATAPLALRLFSQADGMPPSGIRPNFQPSVHQDADGKIWFATYKGLAVIDPASIPVAHVAPQPIIESVVVGSTVYPVDPTHPEVVLPPLTRRAIVNYTGNALGSPDLVRFAVSIDPVDTKWAEVGSLRHAQLLDFKPGRYVVQVRAWREDLRHQQPAPARLVVIFEPAWWETLWFRIFVGVVILGLTGLVFRGFLRTRERRLHERTAQREALEKERQDARDARVASEVSAAASRAKSDFLATMSHEIRTPLNGVIGSAELLTTTELNGEQADHLQTLQSSAESLLGILNDVLDFAKIESGHVELSNTAFDLSRLAREVSEVVVPQSVAKGLEFGLVLAPSIPTHLHGDEGRLRQILLNLLGNAMKFTARGEVELRIQPSDPADTSRIRFEVHDSGIGIGSAALQRVMERFTQADSSTTRRFGGTGLGLTICRSLLELMDSRLEVNSEVGIGTTFAFTLTLPPAPGIDAPHFEVPFTHAVVWGHNRLALESTVTALQRLGLTVHGTLDAPQAKTRLTQSSAESTVLVSHHSSSAVDLNWPASHTIVLTAAGQSTTAPHQLRQPVLSAEDWHIALNGLQQTTTSKNAPPSSSNSPWQAPIQNGKPPLVLLVEDDPTSRRVGAQLLKRLGCDSEVADDGDQAVAAFAPGKFAAILMDCHMPVLDGFSATTQIRQIERATDRRTPIIALTANVVAEDRARCFEVGMDDFLSKPVRISLLGAVLERWLKAPATPSAKSGEK